MFKKRQEHIRLFLVYRRKYSPAASKFSFYHFTCHTTAINSVSESHSGFNKSLGALIARKAHICKDLEVLATYFRGRRAVLLLIVSDCTHIMNRAAALIVE